MLKNFLFIIFSLIILTSISSANETLKYANTIKITDEVTTVTFNTPMVNDNYVIKIKAANKRLNMNLFKIEITDKSVNGFSFKIIDKKWNHVVKGLKIRYLIYLES